MVLVSSARRGRWENVSHQDRKISQMLPETLQRGGWILLAEKHLDSPQAVTQPLLELAHLLPGNDEPFQ